MKHLQVLSNVVDTSENITLAGGVVVSLSMVQTILGITLLIINICLIVAKCVIKVVEKVKKGDTQGAVKDIEDTQKELNSLDKDNGKDR